MEARKRSEKVVACMLDVVSSADAGDGLYIALLLPLTDRFLTSRELDYLSVRDEKLHRSHIRKQKNTSELLNKYVVRKIC